MALADVVEQLQNFDLSEVDWERMGVWPAPVKIALCVAVFAAIVTGGYFLYVKDLYLQLDRVVAKEADLKKSFEHNAFQAANLDAYRAQMAEMEESFGALVAQLPSDTEVPGLLEDIDEKGSQSGLNIVSIDLQSEVVGEFYVELPIKIVVQGGYHDLGSFVSGIAGMPRIVTLHDYSISEHRDSGALQMNILAKTYRYKTQGE